MLTTDPKWIIQGTTILEHRESRNENIKERFYSFSIGKILNPKVRVFKAKNSLELNIQAEVKKHNNILKRNLKTLNYLAVLQVNPSMINNPKRLEEIQNLKNGLERQIIKSTKLLNSYKELQK